MSTFLNIARPSTILGISLPQMSLPNVITTRITAILDGLLECLAPSGDVYSGEFRAGQRHGKGILRYEDGDVYEGEFSKGKCHGKGILRYEDGDVYEGEFSKGDRHGKGILRYKDGNVYEGEFFRGSVMDGGKLIHDFGVCRGLGCINRGFIKDASHIQEQHFLQLLAQKGSAGAASAYPPAVIADFLIKNGFETVGTQLEEAHRTLLVPRFVKNKHLLENYYKTIHQAIQTPNVPKLLCIQSINHAMGLQLMQVMPGYIDCEIFNSGAGLRAHHVEHPEKNGVFQTGRLIRVPAASLTQDKLTELICKTHSSHGEIYTQILTLEGAMVISKDPTSAVWQRQQQSDNCSLMWIFAFLEHNMPHQEYNRMLYILFRECADAAQKAGIPEEIQRELTQQRDLLAPKSKL